ncbi:hypothetical protein B0T24DRAFT_599025 [Lasiosphaeria ovina]|uniref:LSM2-LSM8 complex subunit LSM8 n=1 Tax=Lasiosphaeria ovina TaxID=92902 RepID=A0AAE0JVA7_9PEZI|nr:hypothetical protein B0T24DRAFT_599025 [Lasiosphaeria ovina]
MSLSSYVDKKVCIITTDGRCLVGSLSSYDNTTNLVSCVQCLQSSAVLEGQTSASVVEIANPLSPWLFGRMLTSYAKPQVLSNTVERGIRSADEGVPSAETPVGVYLVRGENVCLVGLVDEELDMSINWTEVKGAPIRTTKNP